MPFATMNPMRLGRFVQINRFSGNCFILCITRAVWFLPWFVLNLKFGSRYTAVCYDALIRRLLSFILNIRLAIQAHISIYRIWIIWQYIPIKSFIRYGHYSLSHYSHWSYMRKPICSIKYTYWLTYFRWVFIITLYWFMFRYPVGYITGTGNIPMKLVKAKMCTPLLSSR